MKIIKIAPRGYCKGVVRAINMAKQAAKDYPNQRITVLGMLVHNRYVIEALEQLHIDTVDDKDKTRMELLDEISEGVVIFTAHGIGPDVIAKAQAKGLLCINASCQDVMRTQAIVQEQLTLGKEILYIGKKDHPEAEAICSLSEHIQLITSIQDIDALDQDRTYFVTNQTTMSMFDIQQYFQRMKQRFKNITFSEEICNATRIRQEALQNLDKDIQVLYVVGDPNSNNSNRLAQIAKEQGVPHVYLIDDVHGIQPEQLQNCEVVAVTAGASTPTYLTNQVITYLESYEQIKEKPNINIADIL